MSAGVGTLIAYMAGGYIAQHYGWRWVFIAAGIPGILIAIVLLLTVREPVRGGMDDDAKADSKTNEEGSEDQLGFIQRLKLVFSEPSLVHCIAGLILVAIASSGLIAWMAPLLIRVHGMELATTGIIVALCIGLASSLGTAGTGLKVDAINKRRGFSARRSALFAAAMPILSTLFGTVAFLASSTVVSVIFLLLLGFVIAAYNGPANGLVITISDKRVRGLSEVGRAPV